MSLSYLLYDGACSLCRTFARLVTLLDTRRRVAHIDFGHPLASYVLRALPLSERYGSFHLVTPDARVHSGSAGVIALLHLLPMRRVAHAVLLRAPWTRRLVAWLYELMVRQKTYRACGVPDCVGPPS